MIDNLFPAQTAEEDLREEDAIAKGLEKFADVHEALKSVNEPHVLLIRDHGGVHCADNTDDHDGLNTLSALFFAFAAIVADEFKSIRGEGATAAFFANVLKEVI